MRAGFARLAAELPAYPLVSGAAALKEVRAMSQTRYAIQTVRGVPVIAAPAALDSRGARVLRTTLLHLAAAGHATVVIDMSTTTTCDAAGRAELGRAYEHAAAEGGDLRLVGRPALMELLGDGGLAVIISRYPTVAAAVAETPAVRIVPYHPADIPRKGASRPLALSLPVR
jgi:anti-anti-sigma regulatory factor